MSREIEISSEKIRGLLGNTANYSIRVYDCIDSTNSEAKRLAEVSAENTVIIAKEQTAGRGRLGRSFYAPKGGGLYLSFLQRCNIPPADIVAVTTAVSVVVSRAIKAAADVDVSIKWVNDLYFEGKKVCGILAEAVWDITNSDLKYMVIGIGINCGDIEFPDDIKQLAGSIGNVDRNRLAAELIMGMESLEEMVLDKSYIDEYRKKSLVIGREIKILNSGETAKAVDIDDFGGLVIQKDGGETKTLSSGEISIRLCGNNT